MKQSASVGAISGCIIWFILLSVIVAFIIAAPAGAIITKLLNSMRKKPAAT